MGSRGHSKLVRRYVEFGYCSEQTLNLPGNGLNVVKVMPESAIKFGGYEAAKRLFSKLEGHGEPSQINPWSRFLAGGMGGIVSQ